jgi:hypothetical protein
LPKINPASSSVILRTGIAMLLVVDYLS